MNTKSSIKDKETKLEIINHKEVDINKMLEDFTANSYIYTSVKDEMFRKEEFKKQLKLLGNFQLRASSFVKQKALIDYFDYRPNLNQITLSQKIEKDSCAEEKKQKQEMFLKQKKEIKVKIFEKEEEKNFEKSKKIVISKRMPRSFDVFFSHSKKKSKERLKVKIF